MLQFEDGVLVFLFLFYVMQLYAYRPLIYNYLEKYKIPYMQKMKTSPDFFFSFLSQDVVIFVEPLLTSSTCRRAAPEFLVFCFGRCACTYPYICEAVFVNEVGRLRLLCQFLPWWSSSFTADLSHCPGTPEMRLFQVSRLFPAAVLAFASLIHELCPPLGRLHGLRCSVCMCLNLVTVYFC